MHDWLFVGFCVWVVFLSFCFGLCVLLFPLHWDCDCCGLCTGPLPDYLLRLNLAGLFALIRFRCSLRHASERVERPGESQLALDGKKMRIASQAR